MKKDLLLTFLLFLLIGWQNLCFAQNSFEKPKIFTEKEIKTGAPINEGSKFFAGDNPTFALPQFDDSSWKHVNFNSKKVYSWNPIKLSSGNVSKKNKIYWVRYYFKIDSTLLDQPLCLNISQLGASEIYLNGKKIESIGNIRSKEFKIKNKIPELFSLDNTDVNVLAIRFLPIIENKKKTVTISTVAISVELVSAHEFIKDKVALWKDFNFYTMLICGIFGALGFIHLLLFLFYRKAIYNLYFSTYNISISLMSYLTLLFSEMTDPLDLDTYTFVSFLAVMLFGTSLTGFVNTLFGRTKKRLKVLLIISASIVLLYYFSATTAATFAFFYISFVAFESFYLIIRAMIRRERSAFIVGGGVLVFFLFIVMVIIFMFLNKLNTIDINELFGDDFIGYVLIFIFISFPVSISAYLGWQFASTNVSLVKQLDEVNRLSDINLKQEQEKQQILQDQNDLLEKQVDERTFELQKEKQKTENLLLNILPHEVAEELKENGSSEAKYYDEVTVLFTDFVNFTQSSEKMGAEKMLVELNECFTAFDMIMEKHGLEKIKTIGDAYLAVCGLPLKNECHAYQTVLVALDIIKFIEERKKTNPNTLDIRIGINSGSLIAGIVGVKKFAYDIWGDTVNTAARMEQNSEKGRINISESTYQLVKNDFNFEFRGKIETKGKGAMEMYFVNSSI
ncbi:adenylate/guanylate cyclase domain-containing protein [Chryseobacterium sp. CFBP8996]|uniref:adenylate/guanylate cyclase domain-containing protein n=1 Tax=Chryseobacterium sp. CFBP8996 TaxID=3096529 RepID=UPI002A69C684|nr:adenylate/guanylate cyclase domain-containing protein [Chryseobacterium sp. CFBP8996]MDY0932993.1 adenylate/guanylate cyclase domain-containing protein [Chryseobacterium sp. CFBP8996]